MYYDGDFTSFSGYSCLTIRLISVAFADERTQDIFSEHTVQGKLLHPGSFRWIHALLDTDPSV